MQGEEIVVENAYLHMIADTLLGSYSDHRTTMPADNVTTAQDIQSIIDKISESGNFNVDTELDSCEYVI